MRRNDCPRWTGIGKILPPITNRWICHTPPKKFRGRGATPRKFFVIRPNRNAFRALRWSAIRGDLIDDALAKPKLVGFIHAEKIERQFFQRQDITLARDGSAASRLTRGRTL
jgi:hypothetical protein